MSTYQFIEYENLRTNVLSPPEVRQCLKENEPFSTPGHQSTGEGRDFILEAVNKRIKMFLPQGLPTQSQWTKVCKNLDNLEKV